MCLYDNTALGNTLLREDEQLRHWSEFFSSQINYLEESSPLQLPTRRNARRDIPTEAPDLGEVERAISKLKSSKTPGPDGIAAELFKCNSRRMAIIIRPIIREAWNTRQIPDRWKEGVINTIPKKGDISECKNWRGITLLNTIEKLLVIIIYDRLSSVIDELLRPNQAIFRRGRLCTDQINLLLLLRRQGHL